MVRRSILLAPRDEGGDPVVKFDPKKARKAGPKKKEVAAEAAPWELGVRPTEAPLAGARKKVDVLAARPAQVPDDEIKARILKAKEDAARAREEAVRRREALERAQEGSPRALREQARRAALGPPPVGGPPVTRPQPGVEPPQAARPQPAPEQEGPKGPMIPWDAPPGPLTLPPTDRERSVPPGEFDLDDSPASRPVTDETSEAFWQELSGRHEVEEEGDLPSVDDLVGLPSDGGEEDDDPFDFGMGWTDSALPSADSVEEVDLFGAPVLGSAETREEEEGGGFFDDPFAVGDDGSFPLEDLGADLETYPSEELDADDPWAAPAPVRAPVEEAPRPKSARGAAAGDGSDGLISPEGLPETPDEAIKRGRSLLADGKVVDALAVLEAVRRQAPRHPSLLTWIEYAERRMLTEVMPGARLNRSVRSVFVPEGADPSARAILGAMGMPTTLSELRIRFSAMPMAEFAGRVSALLEGGAATWEDG